MVRMFFLALIILNFSANAQVVVSPNFKEKGNAGMTTSYDMTFDEALQSLEGSTTYFIIPDGIPEVGKSELSKKLKEIWDLTNKLETISLDEFKETDYRGKKVNFISMVGNRIKVNKSYWFSPYYLFGSSSQPKGAQTNYNELSFWAPADNKKYRKYASIKLTYNIYSWFKKNGRNQKKMRTDLVNNVQYVGNWFNAYIINSLTLIQKKMKSKESIGGDYRFEQESGLKALKKKTLYVPDYVLETRKGFTKEKELLKNYAHPVKVVSKEELNEKIMNSEEAIYYLIGTSSNTEMVLVFDSKTSEVVYHDYIGNSIKLKGKHMAKLSKAISKY